MYWNQENKLLSRSVNDVEDMSRNSVVLVVPQEDDESLASQVNEILESWKRGAVGSKTKSDSIWWDNMANQAQPGRSYSVLRILVQYCL